jgi:peroxiredoxin
MLRQDIHIGSQIKKYWLRWSHTTILTALLVLSVALNLLLAKEVRQSRTMIALLTEKRSLKLNDEAPPLEATGQDGQSYSISYTESEKPTVLYIFTPDCHWCGRNIDNIKSLANQVKDRYRVFGVSLNQDKLGEYINQNDLNFPVLHSPSDASRLNYNMVATPTTIIVSKEHKVIKIWSGAYSEAHKEEIESFFQINLPGLSE